MGKTLTYTGFAISAILVILAFVTAKTYTQLIIAVVVYPLLAYFALKLLPRRNQKAPAITIKLPSRPARRDAQRLDSVEVADVDKRTFLKLVGAAGLSFFVFSILGRRVESLLFGRGLDSGIAGVAPVATDPTSTQIADGYKISEIDEGETTYYGFTNKTGGWLIMREEADSSSFRYAKGDINFPVNWANRANLKYDYFYNLF